MKPIATIIIFSIMLFHFNKVFSKQLPSNSNFEKNKIMHFDDLFLNADSFIAPKYKLMVNGGKFGQTDHLFSVQTDHQKLWLKLM